MGCCTSKYDDLMILNENGQEVKARSVTASYADYLSLKNALRASLILSGLILAIAIVLLVLVSINFDRIDKINHRVTQNYDKILGNFACRVLLDSVAASDGFAAAADLTAQLKGMDPAAWPGYCASQYSAISN